MKDLSNKQILDGLIQGDEEITQHFFKICRPLIISVINRRHPNLAPYVNYNECINELYYHLMEKDARRLKTCNNPDKFFGWLKIVAIRFFKKLPKIVIEDQSSDSLIDKKAPQNSEATTSRTDAEIDSNTLLAKLKNERYAKVLQRLIIDDASPLDVAKEFNVTVENLYNIKSRAIKALAKIIIGDKKIK